MDAIEQFILFYQDPNGECPYRDWFSALRDVKAQARIEARLGNLREGNFGVARSVGGGVSELKIDFGPGYRIYFGRDGGSIVIILCGGSKSSQAKDIHLVQSYWADYKKRRTKR